MGDKGNDEKKKKNPAPVARSATRRKKKGPVNVVKIPVGNKCLFVLLNFCINIFFEVLPTSKCKLRLLKLERIKDFLLMEQEFIQNQEVYRPSIDQDEVMIYITFF